MELPLYHPKAVHYRFAVPQRKELFLVCRDLDLGLARFMQYERGCYASNKQGTIFCRLPLAIANTTKCLVYVLGKLTSDIIQELEVNKERVAALCHRICEITAVMKIDAQSMAYGFVSNPKQAT